MPCCKVFSASLSSSFLAPSFRSIDSHSSSSLASSSRGVPFLLVLFLVPDQHPPQHSHIVPGDFDLMFLPPLIPCSRPLQSWFIPQKCDLLASCPSGAFLHLSILPAISLPSLECGSPQFPALPIVFVFFTVRFSYEPVLPQLVPPRASWSYLVYFSNT